MALVNGNYGKLKDSYLFSQIAAKVAEFSKEHPEKKIIKEVLKSNDSKYPTKQQLLKTWKTSDIDSAIAQECAAIEERNANRKKNCCQQSRHMLNICCPLTDRIPVQICETLQRLSRGPRLRLPMRRRPLA